MSGTDPDWGLQHAKNLRREAEELGRRYWQALSNGDLTPAECAGLEKSRWDCITKAAEIERALRGL